MSSPVRVTISVFAAPCVATKFRYPEDPAVAPALTLISNVIKDPLDADVRLAALVTFVLKIFRMEAPVSILSEPE